MNSVIRFAILGVLLPCCTQMQVVGNNDAADAPTTDAPAGSDAYDSLADVSDVSSVLDAADVDDAATADRPPDVADDVVASIDPPRPIAPLSTATATSRRPTIHWQLPATADGARVLMCRDRALTHSCVSFDVTGTSGVPSADLTPGVWFWHLVGRSGTAIGATPSATWEVVIGARTAPVDSSWGSFFDANGDGLGDLAVGANSENRVHVYYASGTGLPPAANVTITPPMGSIGQSTSSEDTNGDGFSDLVLGGNGGGVFVYNGSPTGVSMVPSNSIPVPPNSGQFGNPGVAVGDVDGDGYGDIMVADNSRGPGSPGNPTIYLYLGSSSGPRAIPDAALGSDGASGNNFLYIAAAGDLNGDGYADAVIANTGDEHARVFFGASSGISVARSVTIMRPDVSPSGTSQSFGQSLAAAGDVDGDGLCDLLIAAPYLFDLASSNTGRVYVYRGAAGTGFTPTPSRVLNSVDPSGAFGIGLSGVGDINGDGYGDVVVGAAQASTNTGRAYVYLGSSAGIPATASATINAPDFRGIFGMAVSGLGDVTGDGFVDVGIGAPALGVGGEVLVYYGGSSGLSSAPNVTVSGVATNAGFGISLALNRDERAAAGDRSGTRRTRPSRVRRTRCSPQLAHGWCRSQFNA